uniref:Lipid droplet assembly factor 1 n=1 Tax=Gallus gallus TaxID=9031 RepID=A0A8V0Z6E5_CHICK
MSKELQELQKQWHFIVQSIHSNSNVVAFMNSRLGLYLDDHPFVALSLLMFVAVSTIPVAFFLIFVVTTVIMACVGVIVMEGAKRGSKKLMEVRHRRVCLSWTSRTTNERTNKWDSVHLLCTHSAVQVCPLQCNCLLVEHPTSVHSVWELKEPTCIVCCHCNTNGGSTHCDTA